MKETFVVRHNIPLLAFRIILFVFSLGISVLFISTGQYFFLILPLIFILYVVTKTVVDIDFEKNTYYEYTSVLGLRFGESGSLSPVTHIMVKDTTMAIRNRMGYKVSTMECYEVALVGRNRFKLVLMYAYDINETIDRILALQEKTGYPIWDLTKEKIIGSDE